MFDAYALSPLWWITAVELPALGGLLLLLWRQRREWQESLDEARAETGGETGRQRDELAAFKLEVAKIYASVSALQEAERRLTAHLVRIERKLDGFGLVGRGVRP